MRPLFVSLQQMRCSECEKRRHSAEERKQKSEAKKQEMKKNPEAAALAKLKKMKTSMQNSIKKVGDICNTYPHDDEISDTGSEIIKAIDNQAQRLDFRGGEGAKEDEPDSATAFDRALARLVLACSDVQQTCREVEIAEQDHAVVDAWRQSLSNVTEAARRVADGMCTAPTTPVPETEA